MSPRYMPSRAGQARQDVGRADVREEADAGLRHREHGALGHDPVRAVHRDADAAAHGDAVEQRDVGLREMVQARVHRVFEGVEARRGRDPLAGQDAVQPADVAAGAERPLARALDQHGVDVGVGAPARSARRRAPAHRQRQRVQRARPVEGDHHQAAPSLEPDLGRSAAHGRQPSSSRRAMISRMISLVPSRIWWTRTSRR